MIFVRSMSKKLNVAKQLSKMKKEQWAHGLMTTTVFCLKGNELFKKTEFEGALDLYNQAIHSCPPHRREYNTYKLDTGGWSWVQNWNVGGVGGEDRYLIYFRKSTLKLDFILLIIISFI